MGIPYARRYRATLTGTAAKRVHCESCHGEYVYQMERTATGRGTSILFLDNEGAQSRAGRDAENKVRSKLEREIDVVPCPLCGWYQATMVPKLRWKHRGWIRLLGFVLLGVATLRFGLSFLEGPLKNPTRPWWHRTSAMVAGACASIGAGLLIIKVIVSKRYDPNSADQDARIALGKSRAITKERLEQLLRERDGSAGPAPSSSRNTKTGDTTANPGAWEADDSHSSSSETKTADSTANPGCWEAADDSHSSSSETETGDSAANKERRSGI
jgi:hypothetical protein